MYLFQSSCIFPTDNKILRRIAYTETADGRTKAPQGGIWNIKESMFLEILQYRSYSYILANYMNQITAEFNIDWSTITWEDMNKPLHSALLARLYLVYKGDSDANLPRDIDGQAAYWNQYYNTEGDEHYFTKESAKLEKNCKDKGVDLVFVTDTSGSVGYSNYMKMLDFVEKTVDYFDISSEFTRVSVMSYSSYVVHEFFLNTYMDKASLLNAIRYLAYRGGGTYTHHALRHLREVSFTEANGARPSSQGVPRVAIVLTDGVSSSSYYTIAEAEKCHEAGITMYAIGIGRNLRDSELEAIASDPVCVNYIKLQGFSEFEYLSEAIQQRSCEAPVVLDNGSGGATTDTNMTLPAGFAENCKVSVGPEGATIHIDATIGGVAYYISHQTYPSESYYEEKIVAFPGYPDALFIKHLRGDNKEQTVFCKIVGELHEHTELLMAVRPGNTDHCASNPCPGEKCVDFSDGGYKCEPLVSLTECRFKLYILKLI